MIKEGFSFDKLKDMMEFLIPNYILEGKNQLVIAIGCTGESTDQLHWRMHFTSPDQEESYGVRIEHRDIGKRQHHEKKVKGGENVVFR